ncbi:peptidoglycan editing factor PgeF [Paenibacillus sambharensis]|uniref:Purine nucleoside phosphorylase n=1 Tax=Paenibacillus sambharensis TaxID=1803190 RepID=A0A2W1L6X8_9BACL|nr:peptidoglycan editing factor PgeF [Paenibacillus sambharensis]PZD93880.1 peptidoglycan editing factor PgeF [Paenibacillus sambharensis]
MEPFVRQTNDGKPSLHMLQSWIEEMPGLTAGITGREGGVSGEPWRSLNCAFHVGDDPEAVIRNRQLVTEALGWTLEAWTCAEQVHGTAVFRVMGKDRGSGSVSRESAIPGADAIMTDVPGVLLASFYADCVPLFFLDPVNHAAALAHAGWKGTVGGIARNTIEAMSSAYGTDPASLRCAIGPSIGACCYEVYGPVKEQITEAAERLSEENGTPADTLVTRTGDGTARVNLKEINRQIMIKAGILATNIEITKQCTGCLTGEFYSHRVEQGRAGRMASFIGFA